MVGLAVGMLIAVVTAPVGVSGVVFLFPVQLGVFTVPNPAVTPTNLLYNVVAVLMLPLGGHLAHRPDPASCAPEGPTSRARAPGGHRPGAGGRGCGRYGIGGGSIPGPVLVGRGVPVSQVAPAALASTFATSVVGASTYAVLSLARSGSIAPVWLLGLPVASVVSSAAASELASNRACPRPFSSSASSSAPWPPYSAPWLRSLRVAAFVCRFGQQFAILRLMDVHEK